MKGMIEMKAELLRFALDRRGATATEYGLLVAGIGLAIASIVGQVGTHIVGALDRVATSLHGG
jgi:Flp pilus assembly pilin Flp